MTKQEHIDYWIQSSNKDWERIELLLNGNDNVFALFSAHLALEKLSNAVWVKDNESNHPPRIHNLILILQQTQTEITDIENLF
jgi:HEPN domain-containing protein